MKYFPKHYHFRTVFPRSRHLLCVWHVANAVWRYLWAVSHGVIKQDRQVLFYLFRQILYAPTDAEYDKGINTY